MSIVGRLQTLTQPVAPQVVQTQLGSLLVHSAAYHTVGIGHRILIPYHHIVGMSNRQIRIDYS
jgi:hypothetical protein